LETRNFDFGGLVIGADYAGLLTSRESSSQASFTPLFKADPAPMALRVNQGQLKENPGTFSSPSL
jgi:hypothetical protein